jgi:hypothetical protein
MPETASEPALLGPASSHETILVVEDDEDVLMVAAESLRGLGLSGRDRRQRRASTGHTKG